MTLRADRTLFLTERRSRLCRLSPAEVAFLLAQHAAHFKLLPTGERHVYALTPGGLAGIVHMPARRLVIRPKIPLANLFFLLDPLAPVLAQPDRSTPRDGREALDFLAGQLALRLRERSEAGLQRGYDERTTTGPFLLGRLDAAAQLRDASAHKERLHCRHDAFTADILCNRAIRSATEVVLASPLLREETRTALRTALRAFAEVQTIPLTPDVWDALDAKPAGDYRPLFDLCRLLADGLAPGAASGAIPGPAFLLNLEQVFERFLTRVLTQAIDTDEERRVRFRAEVQPLIRASVPVAGQPDLKVRPDVLLVRDGVPCLLVDTKWKRLGATPLIPADVYQMLAYCSALAVRRAVLVYPGRRNRTWCYDLEREECRVTVCSLRLIGDRETLVASTRQLLHRLFEGEREKGRKGEWERR
jgi:5-methylcytosine-specific restriction enzyme subunit McrC